MFDRSLKGSLIQQLSCVVRLFLLQLLVVKSKTISKEVCGKNRNTNQQTSQQNWEVDPSRDPSQELDI